MLLLKRNLLFVKAVAVMYKDYRTQYIIKPGDSMVFDHWKTCAAFDTEIWKPPAQTDGKSQQANKRANVAAI